MDLHMQFWNSSHMRNHLKARVTTLTVFTNLFELCMCFICSMNLKICMWFEHYAQINSCYLLQLGLLPHCT